MKIWTCYLCGQQFQTDEPEEETAKRYVEDFGVAVTSLEDETVDLCTTCFAKVDPLDPINKAEMIRTLLKKKAN